MTEKPDETSNAPFVYREPPPSLGLVAHIWAERLGPGAPEAADEPTDETHGETHGEDAAAAPTPPMPEPEDRVIDLREPRETAVRLD